jgi:hypothetical protein
MFCGGELCPPFTTFDRGSKPPIISYYVACFFLSRNWFLCHFIQILVIFNKINILLLLLMNVIFLDISINIEMAAFCSNYHTYGENLDNYENNYRPISNTIYSAYTFI